MGRLIFVIEQKVLLNFFFFLLAAQVLLKIKVSVEPCLVSVVVLMRGYSGTGEYEAGKEKITVYSLHSKITGVKTTPSVKFNTSKVSICVHTIECKCYTFDSVNFLTPFACKFNTQC